MRLPAASKRKKERAKYEYYGRQCYVTFNRRSHPDNYVISYVTFLIRPTVKRPLNWSPVRWAGTRPAQRRFVYGSHSGVLNAFACMATSNKKAGVTKNIKIW